MEAMSRPRGGSSRSGPRGSLPTGAWGYVPRTSDALTTHFPPGLDWRRLPPQKSSCHDRTGNQKSSHPAVVWTNRRVLRKSRHPSTSVLNEVSNHSRYPVIAPSEASFGDGLPRLSLHLPRPIVLTGIPNIALDVPLPTSHVASYRVQTRGARRLGPLSPLTRLSPWRAFRALQYILRSGWLRALQSRSMLFAALKMR